jgi:UDP-glucose 4-epimerase
MKVFLTGGLGFIGSHIVVDLLGRGDEVTILARDPDKIPKFRDRAGISMVQGGLDDHDTIRAAIPGHDACIHNALYWEEAPTELQLKDTRAAAFVFEAAAHAGVEHLIYTSSTAVHRPFRPLMDEEMRLAPDDFYGATKAAGEAFLAAFSHQSDMRCNTIRPGPTVGTPAVEGAPSHADRRFGRIVEGALRGEEIRVAANDGRQFIGADDLAKVYGTLLHTKATNRQVYVAVSENFTTWEQIAREIVAISGSSSRIVAEEPPAPSSLFNVHKLRRDLGLAFDSTIPMRAHLRHLVETAAPR